MSTVVASNPGFKMSAIERFSPCCAEPLSTLAAGCPKRARMRLMCSSAPGPRRRSRNATDSGTRNHTMGMNAAVTSAPAMNTECQVELASSRCTNRPPRTPPIGYPITITARARLRQRRLESSAAAALIEASVPPMPIPVNSRQTSSSGTPCAWPAPHMPIAMATRQPRMVGRRPILSATPPSTSDPSAMPSSSIDNTQPSIALIDAPVLGNAGRGEADREHIEAIECVQSHGDEYGQPLA